MSVYLVDRNEGNLPIYRQIRDILVVEVQNFYKAGELLPSEGDLAQRFGVNRHTLRRAIDEMVAEGIVERRHGMGVYVLEPAINYRIGTKTRFTETLHSLGRSTSSRVIRKQVLPASGTIAERLNLQSGDEVIHIETLRTVEEKPFCLISHFLPFKRFQNIMNEYESGSLHEYLKSQYEVELKRDESLISSILPEVEDASILNMPRQFPVLRVKSLNLDVSSNKPVEYAVTRFRGDAAQLSVKL